MHFVTAKGILSAKNGMNLYRGCSHGCIYCDSRSKCYHMEHDFEDIEVKENAIELLEHALKHKRKKCMIGTGSMTDPYLPLETELGNVRKALSLIDRYGFGFTVITKSNRILRDIDLLQKINEQTKCVVQMTLTTYDEDLCKKIEPNVSTTPGTLSGLNRVAGRRDSNGRLAFPHFAVYQRHRGQYFRYFGFVHPGKGLRCDLLRHGFDAPGRKQGIFLPAVGPFVSPLKGDIHSEIRQPVYH